MIKVDLMQGAPEAQIKRQIFLLEEYPEIAKSRYTPALKRAVNHLSALIKPTIPSPGTYGTGRAAKTFGARVVGMGNINKLRGEVGWYDKTDPWYMNIVEHGAKRHFLAPGQSNRGRSKGLAMHKAITRGAELGVKYVKYPVFIRGVGWRGMDVHPGFGGRFFLKSGYEKGKPLVDQELSAANEQVAKDLAA